MAAGAAIAGAGDLAEFFERAYRAGRENIDELVFGDLKTAANNPSGAGRAVLG